MMSRWVGVVVFWALLRVGVVCAGSAQAASQAALLRGMKRVDALQAELKSCGRCLPRFGKLADDIVAEAESTASDNADNGGRWSMEVTSFLDSRLRILYERQLRAERDRALSEFRLGSSAGGEVKELQRMLLVEREFCKRADEASRGCWGYDAILAELRSALSVMARGGAAERDATLAAAQKNANYFTVLKKVFKELEQAFAKRTGSDSDCTAGVALRVPNTNINLSGALQRSKTTLQVSSVPDDAAPLLGASGFNTRRVPAGDLALTAKCEVNQ